MSDFSTRNIIDYADQDNAVEMRNALYADIHSRVNAHIENHKKALAQSLITPASEEISSEDTPTEDEPVVEEEVHSDEKSDKKLIKKMVDKDCLKKD
jgi:hypothetical protein